MEFIQTERCFIDVFIDFSTVLDYSKDLLVLINITMRNNLVYRVDGVKERAACS